ncbi:MAG: E3 binding domain-containing protein, partial [Alphaproteobacteria bacterium]|nr:E3 binding domain-containing protein [Alphaproteobacteria bacterium]
MPEVVMPRLSDSMEEGTILRWLKSDGDTVTRGEEIVEIETDKATMPYEADADGELHIVAQEGATLQIGAVIATIGEPAAGVNGSAAAGEAAEAAPDVETAGEATEAGTAPAATATATATAPVAEPRHGGDGNGNGRARVKASPLARRIARERDIDLHSITGSGPEGRIVKSDVLAAAQAGGTSTAAPAAAPQPVAAAPAATAEPATGPKGEVSVEELTRLQQVVARRMAESKATVPDFSIATDVDMAP